MRTVNDLFESFNQPFELVDGEVRHKGSEVLDELLEELPTDDDDLRDLLARAGKDFFYAKEDRRLQGLEAITQAFERVKTLLPGDKKRSAENLIAATVTDPGLKVEFETLFKTLTTIHNTAAIRHKETDRIPVDDDPLLIEYLFYNYYNLIRLLLLRLGDQDAE